MSATLEKLGKYEIRRELGSGAMGVVYEAFDPSIERVVALKTIRRDQIEGSEAAEVIERFRREAKAAGRLNYPNIVAIYDFGEDAGTLYIAMEFISGRELKSYFEANERFTVPDIARIMGQLLKALEHAHQNGIVHRDIKPANVILMADGQVKVADFGIARIESSNFTQVGTVFGTPAYMSPEQFMGQVVDRRSDIYSAGVVLYQFLTGERPFTGSATTIMHKALNETPAPPSMLSVQVPQHFDAVVAKAMAKRPADRFQTAAEFSAAIEAAAAGKSLVDPEATVVAGSDATVVAGSDATLVAATSRPAAASTASRPATARPAPAAPAPTAAQPHKQSSAVLWAAIGSGIVVLAGGAWFAQSYFMASPQATTASAPQGAAPAPAKTSAAPATPPAGATTTATSAPAPAPTAEPGTILISAVGLANPADGKYQADKSLLAADVQADSKSQLIEKAIGLYVERGSLAKNYDVLRDRLMANSSGYISRIVQQGEPRMGKDGLMYVTTQATVKVAEVQKSLNKMSREERIQFIRNNGDPKIAVTINVSREDGPGAQNSPVAENLLKERIKSFGFRVVSAEPAGAQAIPPDFAVVGEAKLKKLSAKLQASGITVEKYLLTSWTVRAVDKQTGEEIYHNNKLPVAEGSWATEEKALAAIGGRIADEFSRDFFLQHFNAAPQKVVLKVDGLPDKALQDTLLRELVGLPAVISASSRGGSVYEVQLSGGTTPAPDLVSAAVLKPINAKLGQPCFALGAVAGEQVSVSFDKACADGAVVARFDTNPPASLYAAPESRRAAVLKERKLQI